MIARCSDLRHSARSVGRYKNAYSPQAEPKAKETATMTLAQKLTGVAVFAFAICGVLLTVRADKPPARLVASEFLETSTHSCFDMNGKAFEWGFSNVPFAATCDAKPDAPQ